MRIAIDARMLAHSGIGTYLTHLLRGLAVHGPEHEYIVFTLPGLAPQVPAGRAVDVREVDIPVYGVAEHVRWPRLLGAARPDLVHAPHYNVPVGLRLPFVVTVHDLIHVLFPESMRSAWRARAARFLLGRTVRRARRIVAVSETTRCDLGRVFGVPPARVAVVSEGVEARFRPQPAAAVEAFRDREGLPASYLLYVGLRRPHKNLARLVRAFAAYRRARGGDVRLVLWGRRDARDAATEVEIATHGLEPHVLCVEKRIDAAEMPLLYGGARALVQPSLYEGFGLPPLEAMACGVPVLASDAGSLPEVLGEAALRFAPTDAGALARGIERILHDEDLRRELARRGRARARGFTWDDTARRTLAVYAEALASPEARAALPGRRARSVAKGRSRSPRTPPP